MLNQKSFCIFVWMLHNFVLNIIKFIHHNVCVCVWAIDAVTMTITHNNCKCMHMQWLAHARCVARILRKISTTKTVNVDHAGEEAGLDFFFFFVFFITLNHFKNFRNLKTLEEESHIRHVKFIFYLQHPLELRCPFCQLTAAELHSTHIVYT